MKCSDAGIALIKEFEGCKLTAYPDPATGGDPWTIGIGSTKDVYPGLIITEEQAVDRLRADLEATERCINNSVRGTITQNQFDSLVSLVFNIGCGNFGKSTLLRRLNQGDDDAAAEQFLVWNKAAGKVMAGLTRRREAEQELFQQA